MAKDLLKESSVLPYKSSKLSTSIEGKRCFVAEAHFDFCKARVNSAYKCRTDTRPINHSTKKECFLYCYIDDFISNILANGVLLQLQENHV